MNPPSAVLGVGVHYKVCWLIAYYWYYCRVVFQKSDDDVRCGYGPCKPNFLQMCNNPKVLLICLGLFNFAQGDIVMIHSIQLSEMVNMQYIYIYIYIYIAIRLFLVHNHCLDTCTVHVPCPPHIPVTNLF